MRMVFIALTQGKTIRVFHLGEDVFPDACHMPQPDGAVCEEKSIKDGPMKLDCEGGLGAATQVTGSFGFAAAGYVVKELV